MTRFLKRLVFALATLGLGALAYALLRTEGERSLRPMRANGGSRDPFAPEHEPPPPEEGPEPAPEPARCAAVTASGKRCSRPAEPGSDYCWQHAP